MKGVIQPDKLILALFNSAKIFSVFQVKFWFYGPCHSADQGPFKKKGLV